MDSNLRPSAIGLGAIVILQLDSLIFDAKLTQLVYFSDFLSLVSLGTVYS